MTEHMKHTLDELILLYLIHCPDGASAQAIRTWINQSGALGLTDAEFAAFVAKVRARGVGFVSN